MGKLFFSVCAALGVALACPNSASAITTKKKVFRLLKIDNEFLKWRQAPYGPRRVVTWSVVSKMSINNRARNCKTLVPPSEIEKQLSITRQEFVELAKRAFNAWSQHIPIRFVHVNADSAAAIEIGAQAVPRGIAFADVSKGRAAAANGTRKIHRARVCFNPIKRWKLGFDGDLRSYDLYFALLHEIGHTIGLDHPNQSGQVMSWRYDERVRVLQRGDILGLKMLYSEAVRAPPNVPVVAKTPANLPMYELAD